MGFADVKLYNMYFVHTLGNVNHTIAHRVMLCQDLGTFKVEQCS